MKFSTLFAMPALALFAPCPVWGQAADLQDGSASGSTTGIADIVVTARRTSENLQKTPVSVTALTSATLDNLNLSSPTKITQIVPNVALSQASGNVGGLTAYIRGIGANEPLLTLDSGVGFYIDGVYLGRSAAANLDLIGPERIEVLRGPQGTLFGRNTTGGAINIVTRKPSRDFGVEAKAGVGSFDGYSARIAIDTGILGQSGISATVSGMHRQRHGYADNPGVEGSKDPGALRSDALFAKVHGEWGRLTIDVANDWNRIVGQRNPWQITDLYPVAADYYGRSASLGGAPLIASHEFQRDYATSFFGRQTSTTWGSATTAAYEFSPELTVKSITAWRGWNSDNPTSYSPDLRGQTLDYSQPGFVSVQSVSPFTAQLQRLRQRQFSQESQILGRFGSVSYVAGVYYFNERGSEDNGTAFTLLVPSTQLAEFGFGQAAENAIVGQGIGTVGVNLAGRLQYVTRSTSLAGFGQASWKPTFASEKLELTAGARYTKDKRSVDVLSVNVPQPVSGGLPPTSYPEGPARAGDASFSNWSFLGSASYQWTPAILTFARASTGYKAGGFFARASLDQQIAFGPEKATAFELGFKSDLFDRRLRVNGSVFYTKYRSLQVPQFTSGNSGFVPNANAHYQGFELEMVALPVPELQLDGSVGYVDAVYDKFQLTEGVDITNTARFPYVPKMNAHFGGQYSMPMASKNLVFRADYSYQGTRRFSTDVFINPLNDVIAAPPEHLVSARISLTDVKIGAGKATISVFGENLLNQTVRTAGIDFGPSLGVAGFNFGLPRSWGGEVSVKF